MKKVCDAIEAFMGKGGTKKDSILLVIAGIGVALSLSRWQVFPFDAA